MNRWLFSLCASFCFAGCGLGHAEPFQQYFPLQAGNSWTYQDSASGSRTTMAVEHAANGVFRLTGVPSLGEAIVSWSGDTLSIWDSSAARFEDFLRFGSPVGTRYPIQLGDRSLWADVRATVAERGATVALPSNAETVANGVRFRFDFGGVADAGLTEALFVPARGPVAFGDTFAGPTDWELVSGGFAQADTSDMFTPTLMLTREADGEFTLDAVTVTPNACHSAGPARTGAPAGITVLPEVLAVTLAIQVREGFCGQMLTPVRHHLENLRLGNAAAKTSVSAFAVIGDAVVGRARISARAN